MRVILFISGIIIIFMVVFFTLSGKNLTISTSQIPDQVDYNFHIKPILSDNCFKCHGPDVNQLKAGLRLDLEESAFSELKENPGHFAIVRGDPGKSELIKRINAKDTANRMPPPESNLTLTEREKKLLEAWIKQGAEYKPHWAYIPPEKSKPPTVKNNNWIRNEIDAFVLSKLEGNKLAPSPEAEKSTLIRRVSLDLTGLPPELTKVDQFMADNSPNAYEKLIDEFLESPHYGEKMAMIWLDIARYADSHGYQDDSYRTMWPWRDWVIHAFNSNYPYDQFLTWQLAGDLLSNASKEQILATGFNRNHPITQEGGVIDEEYRAAYVTDRTNTLGKGVLGITLECAKCHDHKYDPISQKEYFGLFDFFNRVDEKGLQMDAVQAAQNNYYADAPFVKISAAETDSLLTFIHQLDSNVNVMVMNDSVQRETFVLERGEYDHQTVSVEPGTPKAILPFPDDLPENRLGLAKWITHRDNPLTARVFVNRIWTMLFGTGLVKTQENFGVQGELPSHPQLLDWLAVDFMENGWDIKALLRKIMMSATYRQSSVINEELKEVDPENRLLARGPRFRMSAEIIRDYILATSGLLNREIGGPSVKPYQPQGLWKEINAGEGRGILTSYKQDEGDKLYRRSVYTFWKRTSPPPAMTIFDAPNRDNCEVRRQTTNTPLQALAMQNDTQILEACRALAQSLTNENNGDSDKVLKKLWQQILLRPPDEEELRILRDYYTKATQKYTKDNKAAEKILTVGEFPQQYNDPVKTASLMLTASIVYNLDETINKE